MSSSFFARLKLALKIVFNRRFTETLLAAPRPQASSLKDSNTDGALQLLALLQKEGRIIDFIQEEITAFSDAQVGAAARVVHQGLRKAILNHIKLSPIATVAEGTPLSLPANFDSHRYRLSGNISGQGPFDGTLLHKGWQADTISLPQTVESYDFSILAPAEVEL